MLPFIKLVPSGISSLTIASPGAVPWFVNLIVYVIMFPAVTVLPERGYTSFVAVMFGLCTSSVTSFVSVAFTVAVLLIVPS